MKTNGKVKNDLVEKKIDELCDAFGNGDDFLVFRKNGNVVNIALPSKMKAMSNSSVSASLAAVMEQYLLDDCNDEGAARLSEIIIGAVEAIVGISPAGGKLASRLAHAAIFGMEFSVGRLKKLHKDIEEDCGDCEYMRTCDNENAIKYRKENGIPKPKKGKKGARKVDVN